LVRSLGLGGLIGQLAVPTILVVGLDVVLAAELMLVDLLLAISSEAVAETMD